MFLFLTRGLHESRYVYFMMSTLNKRIRFPYFENNIPELFSTVSLQFIGVPAIDSGGNRMCE